MSPFQGSCEVAVEVEVVMVGRQSGNLLHSVGGPEGQRYRDRLRALLDVRVSTERGEKRMELVTGIEPVTPSLRVTCSTS